MRICDKKMLKDEKEKHRKQNVSPNLCTFTTSYDIRSGKICFVGLNIWYIEINDYVKKTKTKSSSFCHVSNYLMLAVVVL
jgi:hypothetical protein